MKKSIVSFAKHCLQVLILLTVCAGINTQTAHAYVAKYKEDYYRLYHIHYQQLPDDCIENIYWLEKAVNADFCNPQYAMATIQNENQWEKYRALFMMHVNLKLIEQYLRLGRIYDKDVAYFYDAPWKDEYVRDLQKALSCYEAGYYYWEEAKLWAEKANVTKFYFLFITDQQAWEDERERIVTGIFFLMIRRPPRSTRVKSVMETFLAMEDETY